MFNMVSLPFYSIDHGGDKAFKFNIIEPSVVTAEFSPGFFTLWCAWSPACIGPYCTEGSTFGALGSGCISPWYSDPIYLTEPHFEMPIQSGTNTAQTACIPPGTYYFYSKVNVTEPWGCEGRSLSSDAYEVHVYAVPCGIGVEIVPNKINPYGRGVIPVAILGSEDFSIADIDVTTIRFGPAGAACRHDLTDEWTCNEHVEDMNLDGFLDLMTHYRAEDTGIACGDSSATITGSGLDGTPFVGIDYFETVGCNSNRPPRGMTNRETERIQPQRQRLSSEEQLHPSDLVEEQRVD
jgi:hypothetical protein